MATINPYLNFNGNCEEAFTFYKVVFGGEFLDLRRFKEVPSEGQLLPNEEEWIMHISLSIGQGGVLMGSDRPSTMGKGSFGNNYHISIHSEQEEETVRLFNGLSSGGQVILPLHKTFWNANFGMLIDKFGVQWMVNQPSDENG